MLRFAVLGLLAWAPTLLHACSCVGIASGCDRTWSPGETIFLGMTIAMDRLPQPDPGVFLSSYAARFSVEDSVRAVGPVGSEVVVYTGVGGGDCGYPFVPGMSYLVYASRSADGRLHAGICSPTRPAVMAGAVLRELHALRDGRLPDRFFGMVGMAPDGFRFEDLVDSRSLAGIPVRAIESHGTSYDTLTDDLGTYAFATLPDGSYTIQADLPPGFAKPKQPLAAVLKPDDSGCHVDWLAHPDGQINGTVVDGSGLAISGFVTIQPADPSEAALARRRGGLPGYDAGPDGKFSLPELPPGRYRLVFHPRIGGTVNFRTTFYWPADSGAGLDLAFGQHLDNLLFQVSPAH